MRRPPPALQVFPTLKNYTALRPRRLNAIPIGGPRIPPPPAPSPSTDTTSQPEHVQQQQQQTLHPRTIQQASLHLYHDLGVLVWAGCSVSQVQRIGDVLAQAVAWGGQGGIVNLLDGWEERGVRRRTTDGEKMGDGDVFEGVEEGRNGILKPEALLRVATSRFRASLAERIPELSSQGGKAIQVRETQVILPGSPPPGGIIHTTVAGPRYLPLESYASLTVDPVSGYTIGEARFYTIGTGNYVGAARIDYLMSTYNKAQEKITAYWGKGKLRQRRRESVEVQQEIFGQVVEKIMAPLWDIERAVWANRATELFRSRERKKLLDEQRE